MKCRWILLIILSLLLLAAIPIIVSSPQQFTLQSATNLLTNGGFEGGFREWQGIGELKVAEGWEPWFVENQTAPSGQWYHRPEFKPEQVGVGSERVYQGQFSQKFFTTFSPHNGGIYQRISAEKDAWYTCAGYVYVWSSSENDPDHSTKPGRYRAMLGINGWGDTWGAADTTVYGKEIVDVYDQWVELSVTAQAWGDHITVFTRGNPWFGSKHNDSYWDDIQCSKTEITAQPTYTPYPTSEPCITPLPTPTKCPPCEKDNCPTPEPCATIEPGSIDYEKIRDIVRTELDSTILTRR